MNYLHQISDLLATSQQPTAQQFSLIAQAGYYAVINLAMSSSTNTYYLDKSMWSTQSKTAVNK
ncbi:MAG TPA: hypothetical protein V6C71_20310 [Coleofasciculaceae cyanobacterium]|jgi:protein tyrosine phosphatase (PTP) superfamily phosphohydrolase (DUF442 family)